MLKAVWSEYLSGGKKMHAVCTKKWIKEFRKFFTRNFPCKNIKFYFKNVLPRKISTNFLIVIFMVSVKSYSYDWACNKTDKCGNKYVHIKY